jgi:hypothetical protein
MLSGMHGTVTKAEFARLADVTRGRVSQWISARQLDGDALVSEGRSVRINVEAARRQLGDRLSVDQRAAHGKARRGAGGGGGTLEALQRERLVQLRHQNARAVEEAAVRSGRYVEVDAMRQELGRVAGRLVALYDGALPGVASAIAAGSNRSARDALHLLRTAVREAREKISGAEAEAAAALPDLVEAAE